MADRPQLYVNARFLTQEVTGVQRFAREISLRLRALWPNVIFLCPRNVKDLDMARMLNAKVIGRATGHRWEQWDLPCHLRGVGSPLLLNLTSTAPVFYKNQVATLHDINFVRNPRSFSFQFRILYRFLIPLILRRVRALITVSEFSKREISGYYKYPAENITVVPNAVDLNVFHAQTPVPLVSDAPYLLAVSSNNYHKNFQRLIEAFLSLGLDNKIRLYVVGGHNASFSSSPDSSTKLAASVRFLGRVTDEQLVSLYAGALAFIFPSLYEGFGIPPLEAQACGCPVLASSATSIPEVLGESAVYFDPTDVDAISAALLGIIDGTVPRDEFIRRGTENVRRYSWAESAQRVVDALCTVSRKTID